MKKALTIVLVALMMLSTSAVALADNTTVLTTTVPAATYTLNIPADQTVAFGATSTNIGNVTVTESSGFAEGKNLAVTATYGEFTCADVSTTIPMSLQTVTTVSQIDDLPSGSVLTFLGKIEGNVTEKGRAPARDALVASIYAVVDSADWGKALAGEYTATITFTAEVVVE